MDDYGRKLIEQGAREEREAIINLLEDLIEKQQQLGVYAKGCPSVDRALLHIRNRGKEPNERAKERGMKKPVLCKDCKYLIWYAWWWPFFMGITEIEEKQDCDHPQNHEVFHDAVTGEDNVLCKPIKSPQLINKNRDCEWFEVGKRKDNLEGKMSEEDKLKLQRHQQNTTTKRRWWQL